MGGFLSAPVTKKDTEEGQNAYYSYAVSSMQGWRTCKHTFLFMIDHFRKSPSAFFIAMEDAHITSIDLENIPKYAYFGVFDGHGGKIE